MPALAAMAWMIAPGCVASPESNGDSPDPELAPSTNIEETGEILAPPDNGADSADPATGRASAIERHAPGETSAKADGSSTSKVMRSEEYTLKNPSFSPAGSGETQVMSGKHFRVTGAVAAGFAPSPPSEPSPTAASAGPGPSGTPPPRSQQESPDAPSWQSESSAVSLFLRLMFLAPLSVSLLSAVSARRSPMASFWKRLSLGFGVSAAALALPPLGEVFGMWTL